MKNYIILYKKFCIISAILLVATTSCKKLNETPKSFATPENFYTTPAQIEAVFASSMNTLWDSWTNYSYGMSVFRNDDQLDGGDLNITENWGSGFWSAHYKAILNLNAAIKALNIGNLEGIPQSDMDVLMGQAKMLRAYNYFMLVRMFGDIPLITESIEDPIHAEINRATTAEVYNLITADLLEAVAKLPASWPSAQRGRPAADAAKGLLAKVYLTMASYPLNKTENYQKAAEMAAQVILSGRYSLVPDVHEVFSLNTKYGPEMMWSFNSNYEDLATDPQIWTDMDGWGDFSADPVWVGNYPDQPRKYAYVQVVSKEGDNYLDIGALPGIKKYLYDTDDDYESGRSVVNIPILRYADVLLIFAEADNLANNGPTQEAVDAVNQIINRANGNINNPGDPLATPGMSKEDFDAKVIQERNLELCFEFDRWFDLIRKHILKEMNNPEVQQNFSEEDYLFPIPSDDIRLNPALTQNPGYN